MIVKPCHLAYFNCVKLVILKTKLKKLSYVGICKSYFTKSEFQPRLV
jgi:hypothetical protein